MSIISVTFTLPGAGTSALCSLGFRRHCEHTVSFDMTTHEMQDLHCVDESRAVKASCANGTGCCFCVTTPFVVEGCFERCFAARTQCKSWVMCNSMVG